MTVCEKTIVKNYKKYSKISIKYYNACSSKTITYYTYKNSLCMITWSNHSQKKIENATLLIIQNLKKNNWAVKLMKQSKDTKNFSGTNSL